uniref:Uncharacterized protein n=1 Tax=Biomphalaria glabrata TaxID=6526 RepID=A0A2C9M7X2_BIOGL
MSKGSIQKYNWKSAMFILSKKQNNNKQRCFFNAEDNLLDDSPNLPLDDRIFQPEGYECDTIKKCEHTKQLPSPPAQINFPPITPTPKSPLLVGGRQGKLPTTACEVYDFSTNKWTKLQDIPSKRVFAMYASTESHLFSVGGLLQPANLGFSDACEVFSIEKGDLGVLANMGDDVLNDNNDSTCVKQNNVTIDWQHELQAVTWVRLVFTNNDDIADVEALYFEDQNSEPYETCGHHYLKIHKTGNTAIDLHCVNSFFIRLLKVSWNSDSPLCSVYVSGGRNVAPGSRQVKWNIQDKRPTSIDTLTDGHYENKGCLMMISNVTLQLFFWKSIFSSEIRLFTDPRVYYILHYNLPV